MKSSVRCRYELQTPHTLTVSSQMHPPLIAPQLLSVRAGWLSDRIMYGNTRAGLPVPENGSDFFFCFQSLPTEEEGPAWSQQDQAVGAQPGVWSVPETRALVFLLSVFAGSGSCRQSHLQNHKRQPCYRTTTLINNNTVTWFRDFLLFCVFLWHQLQ